MYGVSCHETDNIASKKRRRPKRGNRGDSDTEQALAQRRGDECRDDNRDTWIECDGVCADEALAAVGGTMPSFEDAPGDQAGDRVRADANFRVDRTPRLQA